MFDFKHKSLPETTAEKILSSIINNNYEVGDKIPNEFEIAENLGVGRSTVREAIRLLASRNILIVKRGAGTFIADKTGVTEDPLGLSFIDDKYKLAIDLVNIRLLLEPETAALAALNATDSDIAEIEKHYILADKLSKEKKSSSAPDIKFHELIAVSSGNIVMGKLISIISTSVSLFANIQDIESTREIVSYHKNIFESIKKHDPISAKYAMATHLLCSRDKILEIIDKVNRGE